MPGEFKPTDAQAKGYTAREVAKINASAETQKALIDNFGALGLEAVSLVKEFVKTSVSNPITGAASAIIIADILQRAGIISSNAEGLIDGVAVAVVGASVAGTVGETAASIIDTLNPFDMFKSAPAPPNDLSPSATTVVFGDSNPAAPARALMRLPGGGTQPVGVSFP